jgi:hypothetical protein
VPPSQRKGGPSGVLRPSAPAHSDPSPRTRPRLWGQPLIAARIRPVVRLRDMARSLSRWRVYEGHQQGRHPVEPKPCQRRRAGRGAAVSRRYPFLYREVSPDALAIPAAGGRGRAVDEVSRGATRPGYRNAWRLSHKPVTDPVRRSVMGRPMLRAAEMSQKWAANLIRAMNRDTSPTS